MKLPQTLGLGLKALLAAESMMGCRTPEEQHSTLDLDQCPEIIRDINSHLSASAMETLEDQDINATEIDAACAVYLKAMNQLVIPESNFYGPSTPPLSPNDLATFIAASLVANPGIKSGTLEALPVMGNDNRTIKNTCGRHMSKEVYWTDSSLIGWQNQMEEWVGNAFEGTLVKLSLGGEWSSRGDRFKGNSFSIGLRYPDYETLPTSLNPPLFYTCLDLLPDGSQSLIKTDGATHDMRIGDYNYQEMLNTADYGPELSGPVQDFSMERSTDSNPQPYDRYDPGYGFEPGCNTFITLKASALYLKPDPDYRTVLSQNELPTLYEGQTFTLHPENTLPLSWDAVRDPEIWTNLYFDPELQTYCRHRFRTVDLIYSAPSPHTPV